jgi:putative flippase GtrA
MNHWQAAENWPDCGAGNSPSGRKRLSEGVTSFRSISQSARIYLAARLHLFKKAGSFAVIGLINTLIDFGVFVVALQVFGLALVPANILAWATAVSGSYVMNSYTTFAAESGRKLNPRAYGAFIASGVLGLIANTAVLVVVSHFAPVLVAKIVAISVSFLVNFTLSHILVFGSTPRT